jgi:hypothetical protein
MLVDGNGPVQKSRQTTRQRRHAGILKQMDQTTERTFVNPEAGRTVKPTKARAASGTDSRLIERPWVQKRGIANRAEVIGVKGRRGGETSVAHWDSCPFDERALTDAAIVGEKQRKNTVRDPANEIESGRSRYRATREGAPPVMSPFAATRKQSQAGSSRCATRRGR